MIAYPIFCIRCNLAWVGKYKEETCSVCGGLCKFLEGDKNMYVENPKQVGSNLIDCKPQTGKCPMNCNQCFYNRPGASYVPIESTNIPFGDEAEGKIVRMNSLHDSNIRRSTVLRAAKRYKHVFFNTSIPNFDFPGPVVYTANPAEEQPVEMLFLRDPNAYKLMFIRLRVSAVNLHHIREAVRAIHEYSDIPIVLTFMAYYERPDWMTDADFHVNFSDDGSILAYVWKVRHINQYWCPTKMLKKSVLKMMRDTAGRQVTICGTLASNYCRDCRNCEAYYWITQRLLFEREGQNESES